MIHPQSKLGQLESKLETERTAHQATTDHLATLQSEAGDLDRWIERAGLDTQPLDFAKKHARRMIVANVMAKVRSGLATQRQTVAALEQELAPRRDQYIELSRELVGLEDQTNDGSMKDGSGAGRRGSG